MTTAIPPKRFISIRLTDAEFEEVYRHVQHSTCRSLTEYAKKLLTGKPITIKTRNESQDQLLQEIIHVKNKLTELADTHTTDPHLPVELTEIKSLLQQIAKKWLPS